MSRKKIRPRDHMWHVTIPLRDRNQASELVLPIAIERLSPTGPGAGKTSHVEIARKAMATADEGRGFDHHLVPRLEGLRQDF